MIKSNNNYGIHILMKKIKGNKILDYRWRTRIDEKNIPQYFIDKIVFISYNSFQQTNSKLLNKIRRYVKNNIRTEYINAIGGESYLYSEKNIFYTNSEEILKDYNYNGYKKGKLIDYNNIKELEIKNDDTIINLAKLNINILNIINKSISDRIIIINCHHKDFWKKIKYLTNYKLIKRKLFIDEKLHYFISVNIFIRKSFVSLGGNCSITYQLKKYNLRNIAYPFDWSKIKINSLINVFQNNFINFENVKINKYSDNHNSYLITNNYLTFAHQNINNLDIFKFKLLNRIQRLKDIKYPTFIRIEIYKFNNYNIYRKYWLNLCSIFDKLYNSNYKIILLSSFNPNIPKIKWYYFNQYNNDWKYNFINWKQIFYN
jgi:hypothetical protein